MKRRTKILRILTAITLLTPYFSFVLPKQNMVSAAGKGNCAESYFEELGTEPEGTIVKDETWVDADSTKTFTVASGNVISMVFIKSGKKEGFCLAPITEDGSYNDGHFVVSGVRTNSVTITESGDGQNVSHTEFVVTTTSTGTEPTCETGTPAWAYSVVDSDQNETIVAPSRSDVTDVLGIANSVDGTEGTFYSLGLGGFITIGFEYPLNNLAGHDFEISEVTWGGASGRAGHKESATVEVSPDGIVWAKVADIDNQAVDGISGVDFDSSNFDWIKYVRITDTTKTTYPTSPSTDGFDIDAVLGLSGTCGEIDEDGILDDAETGNCETVSGYKWLDVNADGLWNEGENGLANWKIELFGNLPYVVETALTVPADGTVVNTPVLEDGKSYIIAATGTANAGDTIDFDAKYSITNRIAGDTWTDTVSDYETYGTELLDLQIDGDSPVWGNYSENHEYYLEVVGDGEVHELRINDIYYPNNTGSLTVELLTAGETVTTTDEAGYYEFTVCNIGEYQLAEIQQDGFVQTYPESEIHNFSLNEDGSINTESKDFDFGNSVEITESTVSLCKSDEKKNMLSGWNLSLRSSEASAEVEVPSNGTTVSANLEAGTYVLVASGTYKFWNWGPTDDVEGIADAGYSRRPNLSTEDDLEDYLWVNGDDLGAGWVGFLEVRVANTNVNWGDFNNDHVYELVYTHAGGNLDLTTLDSYYGDNSGTINVKAYRVYDGVTNDDGCVAFEGVDFGDYVVGEVMQEKYENESGLGEVIVDDVEERFVVVNNYIDPVDLVIEKSENDADNTVVAGDALTYTIRYANVGEDTAHNVVIKETVPAGTTYTGSEGWVCEATPAVAGTVCRYTIGDLAGQNTTAALAAYQTVNFTVTVNSDVTVGTEIENTAVIASDEDEEITENNEDSADDVTVDEVKGTEEVKPEEKKDDKKDDGKVAGESTTTTPKQEVLGANTTTGAVQGASTELAETGTRYTLIVAGFGLIIFAGSSVALLRKKK